MSLSAVLAKYPLGVVEECCDPTQGLALEREFPPTPKAIADWCDRQVKRHQGAILWAKKERAEKVEAEQFTDERRQSMLGRLKTLFSATWAKQGETAQ